MNYGKVYNYNNIYGYIKDNNKKIFTFSYYALEDEIKNGDLVIFKIADKKENIAIDVMKCNKEIYVENKEI